MDAEHTVAHVSPEGVARGMLGRTVTGERQEKNQEGRNERDLRAAWTANSRNKSNDNRGKLAKRTKGKCEVPP